MAFVSTHKLEFEVAPFKYNLSNPPFMRFRIGQCSGIYRSNDGNYEILGVHNNTPGNGHFEDVLDWFYMSCKRDKQNLVILELINNRFKKHLIDKRGFVLTNETTAVKFYKDM